MPVGIWQKCQVASAFYGCRQLSLVMGFRARNSTRHDFSGLRDICLEQIEILVIDLKEKSQFS